MEKYPIHQHLLPDHSLHACFQNDFKSWGCIACFAGWLTLQVLYFVRILYRHGYASPGFVGITAGLHFLFLSPGDVCLSID
jgi:hypothetical protein